MQPRALNLLVLSPWIAFGAVWAIAALFTNRAVRREPPMQRLRYGALIGLACLFMFTPFGAGEVPWLQHRLWPDIAAARFIGIALSWAGIAFTFWARATLGRMWSGSITLKQDHHLVQAGPYALARHPIYTGICAAFLGSAVALGTVRALLAMPLFVAAFVYKLGKEERLMAEAFGEEHARYRAKVKRLVPFIW